MYVPAVQAIKNLQRLSLMHGFVALFSYWKLHAQPVVEDPSSRHTLYNGHLAALGSGGAVDA